MQSKLAGDNIKPKAITTNKTIMNKQVKTYKEARNPDMKESHNERNQGKGSHLEKQKEK